MAQELQLSDHYTAAYKLQGAKANSGGTEHSERRLLRIGILTLGVLCIIQASLNISLRLAFHPTDDPDQDLFNSSIREDLCQTQQNSTQSCFCYKKLLRRLLRENQALETERDILRGKVRADSDYEYGSG